jgi:putative hydrolase of HD superfamily
MKSEDWLQQIDARLAAQFKFLIAADRLKTVMRRARISDDSRHENSAEHSWHLTLFALVLQEWAVGAVDVGRVVQMLILHDLVEIECGDTAIFDEAAVVAQEAREQEAADVVFGMLPDDQAGALRALWDEFEAAQTVDAKFAKALDRLQPILLNHVVGGGSWTEAGMDIAWERRLTARIEQGSPTLWAAANAVFEDAVAKGWMKAAPSLRVEDAVAIAPHP